jgi:RHH-type proline utilization regulon transcriptional repressor/proline dehydrogenase/delta 1-pyrroline-5-carboxylate dehydrogenase
VIAENPPPDGGFFVAPTVISVASIKQMQREIFGPVLHLATFRADQLDQVIDDINSAGYGLTFGLHTRIDDRVQHVVERLNVGNLYVNRNQIGAVVGSQPFGGEGLSGTGPKAGGPAYLQRFCREELVHFDTGDRDDADIAQLRRDLAALKPGRKPVDSETLPGPTGELNRLSSYARAPFLCLGPGADAASRQLAQVQAAGGLGVMVPDRVDITGISGIGGVIWWGDDNEARALNKALAARDGAILPLLRGVVSPDHVRQERHLCVDTTAAGGNAGLLAQVAGA